MTTIIQFERADLEQVVRNCLKEAMFEIKSLPSPEEIQDRILFNDACQITGLSESAMRKLCMKGEIPVERYGGRRLVFSRRALKEWMKNRTVPVSTPGDMMAEKMARDARRRA